MEQFVSPVWPHANYIIWNLFFKFYLGFVCKHVKENTFAVLVSEVTQWRILGQFYILSKLFSSLHLSSSLKLSPGTTDGTPTGSQSEPAADQEWVCLQGGADPRVAVREGLVRSFVCSFFPLGLVLLLALSLCSTWKFKHQLLYF